MDFCSSWYPLSRLDLCYNQKTFGFAQLLAATYPLIYFSECHSYYWSYNLFLVFYVAEVARETQNFVVVTSNYFYIYL